MPTTLPGLPNREAGWIVQQMDKKLKAFPEVERVFGKIGRADTSTDPAPLDDDRNDRAAAAEVEVAAGHDEGQARRRDGQGGGDDRLRQRLGAADPRARHDAEHRHPDAGRHQGHRARTSPSSRRSRSRSRRCCADLPGTKSVIAERISEGYYVDVRNDLERMAEHGVTVDEAMATVRYAIGGDNIVGVKQADNTVVPLSVQYSPEYIDTLDKMREHAGRDRRRPRGAAGRHRRRGGAEDAGDDPQRQRQARRLHLRRPAERHRSRLRRRARRQLLAKNLTLPAGYSIEWTGLYQYAAAARARLRLVVPLTLVIIFGLLVVAFRSVAESVLILLSVPFAMVGGVFLQWMLGYPMTTAVIVGYISLFAVAVQTGIIMVIFIRGALDHRTAGAVVHRRRDRRIGDAAAAEADDRGGDRPVAAAGDVRRPAPAWRS